MIYLDERLKWFLADFVKPICMPLRGESKAPGQYLDVAGWGVTETGNYIFLQKNGI